MSVKVCESNDSPKTVKDLRVALEGVPDSITLICEDGRFVQGFVEKFKLCEYVVIGDGGSNRTFLAAVDLESYQEEYPSDAVLKLEHPVFCIDVSNRIGEKPEKPPAE